MNYLILIAIVALLVLLFRRLSSGAQKSHNGLQGDFALNPSEVVVEEWEIYIVPQVMPTGFESYGFFETGGVFTLLKTDQARLILKHGNRAFVFDQANWPTFRETSKKASLHLFTRVSEARVLTVDLAENDLKMEWHVPRELRIVSE